MTPRRALAPLLAVALSVAACASAATPTTGPAGTPSPAAQATATAASPTASATPRPTPSPTPSASPSPTPSSTATAVPTAPTAEAFWSAAASALDASTRVRVRVSGPAPGDLRYEPLRSATVIDGKVVFVCVGGRAYDGQSGFAELPGEWTCGTEALVRGFRLMGQPLDAWNSELPPDQEIQESVDLEADGAWRWEYRGRNPFAGGDVRTQVVLDPATGHVRSAARTDPTGATTYAINYAETFPPIALP